MLLEKIKTELVTALKAGEKEKAATLRFLLAAVKNFEIAKYPPSKGGSLCDEDIILVVKKLASQHKESIEMFKKGGRIDLTKKEEAELSILKPYLPPELSDEELREIVKKAAGTDFGETMKKAMAEVRGRADGSRVAMIVKETIK